VFLNEERNELGEQAFQAALDYVKKNENLGIEIGEVITAVGNITDAHTFLQSGKCNSTSNNYVTCQVPTHVPCLTTFNKLPTFPPYYKTAYCNPQINQRFLTLQNYPIVLSNGYAVCFLCYRK